MSEYVTDKNGNYVRAEDGRLVRVYRESLLPQKPDGWAGRGTKDEPALPDGSESVFWAQGEYGPDERDINTARPTRGVFSKEFVAGEVEAGRGVLKRSLAAKMARPDPLANDGADLEM
jgi:hypothetical protein